MKKNTKTRPKKTQQQNSPKRSRTGTKNPAGNRPGKKNTAGPAAKRKKATTSRSERVTRTVRMTEVKEVFKPI